ncbi:MAG: hypothetical protein NUW37_01280 [Planctomycetes bacterium]|nr:hypothetical protein [Planctomycetota bacterium]
MAGEQIQDTRLAEVIAANRRYRDIIEKDPESSKQQYELLNKKLAQRGLVFGGQPITVYIKPDFITTQERDVACHIVHRVIGVLEKAIDLYEADPGIRSFFGLTPEEDYLVRINHGYKRRAVLSRLDGFLHHQVVKFLEFNMDSPAGPGFMDLIEEEMFRLPLFREFLMDYQVGRTSRRMLVLQALLDCYRDWGGVHWPRIAIVDWNDVATLSEFLILREFFIEHGFETVIADPRELDFSRGRLRKGDLTIDIVYRRILTHEVARHPKDCKALVEAVKQGAVCMVNSFKSKLASSKALLTIFTDTEYERYFTAQENRTKRVCLPWTARIQEGPILVAGKLIDGFDFVCGNKNMFVLKAGHSHGGKDVYIGRETPEHVWDAAMERALFQGNWVAQEYVPIPEKSIPVFSPDLKFEKKKINMNPFSFLGHYGGGMSRISSSSIINVSRGGGLVPVMPCRKRVIPLRAPPEVY